VEREWRDRDRFGEVWWGPLFPKEDEGQWEEMISVRFDTYDNGEELDRPLDGLKLNS
jgi:hypothetical protein